MSFFSTSDILKSLISGDLLKDIVTSDEFSVALKEILKCDNALANELARLIFLHPGVKKEVRKIVLDILADMGIKDEVDNIE